MGSTTSIMWRITESGTMRAMWEPIAEPHIAIAAEQRAITTFPFKYPWPA